MHLLKCGFDKGEWEFSGIWEPTCITVHSDCGYKSCDPEAGWG